MVQWTRSSYDGDSQSGLQAAHQAGCGLQVLEIPCAKASHFTVTKVVILAANAWGLNTTSRLHESADRCARLSLSPGTGGG